MTINIGNYESQRYDLSITTRVPDSVDLNDAMEVTNSMLADAFDKQGKKIYVRMQEFLEGVDK